jgi:hypothetical protein
MKLIFRAWIAFSFIVLIIAGIKMPALAQQSEPITFKLEICGRGIKPILSSQSYSVSDGTGLFVQLLSYETSRDAKKAVAKKLKNAIRIEDRKDETDTAGKKIGEKIFAIVLDADGTEKTLYLSLKNNLLYKIEAASLHHIQEFEKLTATEQINGREGETATLLFGLSVSVKLRVGGFASRRFGR